MFCFFFLQLEVLKYLKSYKHLKLQELLIQTKPKTQKTLLMTYHSSQSLRWTVVSVGTLWTPHLSHYNGRRSPSPIMFCLCGALGNVWNEQPATISSVNSQLNRELMNHSKQLVGCSKRELLRQKPFIGGLSTPKWINYILRLVKTDIIHWHVYNSKGREEAVGVAFKE